MADKTKKMLFGATAVSAAGLLLYGLSRPTKKNDPKKSKLTFELTFDKKPIDIHLVMLKDDGLYAHVGADRKNLQLGLKYGARVTKINEKNVENARYEEIVNLLMYEKTPITIQFHERPDLERQWTEADKYKEEANYFYSEGNIVKGIAYVDKAIKLHSTNKVFYSNRVLMLMKIAKYEKALEDCQKMRELDPLSLYIKGHYLRGLVLFHLKKYKNAAAAFKTVIKLEPTFKQAKERLDECQQMIQKEQGGSLSFSPKEQGQIIQVQSSEMMIEIPEQEKNKPEEIQYSGNENKKETLESSANQLEIRVEENGKMETYKSDVNPSENNEIHANIPAV